MSSSWDWLHPCSNFWSDQRLVCPPLCWLRVIADALFGPKIKGLNINYTSCVIFPCFSTVMIPGIHSFYQHRHSWLLGNHTKRRPVMNIPALFSAWDKHVCRHAVNGLTCFCRRVHEERHCSRRHTRPISGRGFSSRFASFIFTKTGSALGSCAHKLIFCYILLRDSAAPSSVFSGINETMATHSLFRHWQERFFLYSAVKNTQIDWYCQWLDFT